MRFPILLGVLGLLTASEASAHEFVGWFDQGQAELSPRGYQVAREAAHYWSQSPSGTRLIVEGHLDIAEQDQHHLDVRRAQAMMVELAVQGVPPSSIDIVVHGFSRPARAGGGAHEVNRRVLINFRQPPAGQPPEPPRLTHDDQPIVFFESGSAVVHQEIGLRLASFNYQPGGSRVVIEAYTDTLGSREANQRLSQARTESIARVLVRFGVLWSDIELRPWGEARLSKPTPDEVAEPLNRWGRVFIFRRPEPGH